MSFTDPLSITINAVTTPLPRVGVEENGSTYASGDGLIHLSASHDYGKRWRRLLRLDTAKMAPDAFRPAENTKVSMSCYMVFDLPPSGYTPTEALQAYVGFKTLYTATSDLMITKLLGGES